ncbi:MAG: EAL domain-containing protein, partial [Aurantimicrobium sp.]
KLKIDGQFIRDVIVDPLDNATVRCFVEVAKLVNMKTVAEFVDSAAVLEKITEMGVDYAQGYHLHRPEPIQNVLNMVEQLATLPAIGNDC